MKRLIVFIAIAVALGIACWLLLPFFVDKRVSEVSPVIEQVRVPNKESDGSLIDIYPRQVAGGSFVGFDKIHYGSGTASLIQTETGYVVRFEEDFAVANGPDLYVGLGNNGQYEKGFEISRLKGNIGSQNYVLPEDFDINITNEVWIWCKAFSVPFAKAVFVPGS